MLGALACLLSFTAPASALTPTTTITLLPPTAVTDTSVTLNVLIDDHGQTTTYQAEYGPLAGPPDQSSAPRTLPGRTGPELVHLPVLDLEPGTSFFYRITTTSPAGTAYSQDGLFDTLGRQPPPPGTPPPQVQTGPPLRATAHTAELAGGLYSPNIYVTYAFEFGPTTDYGQRTLPLFADPAPSPRTVTAELSGLAQAATYHYRLIATIGAGNVYGADHTFQTLAATRAVPSNLTLHARTRALRASVDLALNGHLQVNTAAAARDLPGGAVAIRINSGGHAVSRRRVYLSPNGTYQLRLRISRARLTRALQVTARYEGNATLAPVQSRRLVLRLA